ncbi:MAG: sel1 repeat family protein [Rhodanobacteraceae bacterium]
MNRPILLASLCASLLGIAVTVVAATLPPSTTSATTDAAPKNPIPAPPKADSAIERTITAMNSASTWGHPDLFGEFAGMRLYSEGHYKAAIKYFKYGARYADKLSQLSIGLMYENGHGVERDPVTACAWLALAAQRKYQKFVETRDRVCEGLTPTQHDQAVTVLDKLLPVYGDKVAKHRMAVALRLAKMQTTGSRLGFDSGITTVSTNPNCGGPAVSNGGIEVPQAGCGSTNFWSPWRWDPKKYFAARDAQWGGTVTVGTLQQPGKTKTDAAASKSMQPASASSADH